MFTVFIYMHACYVALDEELLAHGGRISVVLRIVRYCGDCWRGRQSWTPLLCVILRDAMSVDVDVRHRLGNRIANCNVDVGVSLGRLVWYDILNAS